MDSCGLFLHAMLVSYNDSVYIDVELDFPSSWRASYIWVYGGGVKVVVVEVMCMCTTHLLLVVQALIVILQHRRALLLARRVLLVAVDHVAGEHLLPEGEAPGWTWLDVKELMN